MMLHVKSRKRAMTRKLVESEGPYLIWSHYHGAWWRPKGEGYTTEILAAGVFTYPEAKPNHDVGRFPCRDEAIPVHKMRARFDLELSRAADRVARAQTWLNQINETHPLGRPKK